MTMSWGSRLTCALGSLQCRAKLTSTTFVVQAWLIISCSLWGVGTVQLYLYYEVRRFTAFPQPR